MCAQMVGAPRAGRRQDGIQREAGEVKDDEERERRERGEGRGGEWRAAQQDSVGLHREKEKVQRVPSCGSRATFQPGRRDAQQM